MKIRTSYDHPAIPIRAFDWSAVTDNYDGAPDSRCPVGHGPTKEAAIADLLEKIEERSMINNDMPPVLSGDVLTADVGHTPGPWRLDAPSNAHVLGDDYHVIEGGIGCRSPENGMMGFRITAFMSLADAKLVHAAPDMAEALRAAQRLAWEVGSETEGGVQTLLEDGRGDLYRQISAALAKAGL